MTRIRQHFNREKAVTRERPSTKANRSQVWPAQRTQPVRAISADVRHPFAPAPPLGIGTVHGLVGLSTPGRRIPLPTPVHGHLRWELLLP